MQNSGTVCCLQAQRLSLESLRAADTEGIELYSNLELSQNLSPDVLPSYKITLILGNTRIAEMSLSDDPVFMVC